MLVSALVACGYAQAGDIKVSTFSLAGPYAVPRPVMVDSVNMAGKAYDDASLLDADMGLGKMGDGTAFSGEVLPASQYDASVGLLTFMIQNKAYAKAKVKVGKLGNFRLYIDGQKVENGAETTLEPSAHEVVIKYLSTKDKADSIDVTVQSECPSLTVADTDAPRFYTNHDVMVGKRVYGTQLSYDGRYLITSVHTTEDGGHTFWRWHVNEVKTGRTIAVSSDNISWLPGRNAYWYTKKEGGNRMLISVDVATGKREVMASAVPEGYITMAPTGKYVILSKTVEGPKDDKDVHQILSPEDRQAGWRDRTQLIHYDLSTGVSYPLTYGYHSIGLQDISADGRYLLFSTMRERLTQRPTSLMSLYRLDLNTMQTDTIVRDDGFFASAVFSPDASRVAVMGSPECLGGVGKNVPEGYIPSMYDYQLYVVTIASGKVLPLTKTFNPGIEKYEWNRHDGKIYFTAMDRDYVRLYSADATTGKIAQLNTPEDVVSGFGLADGAPLMAWYGQGASNSDRVYTLSTKGGKSTLVHDYSAERLKGIKLGKCEAWDFINSRGDTISGRFYLPPDFDATKKYPLIVSYYGGCSPTSRDFESRYPRHAYAALGYVVYVVNPSGAVGFGQEFSARHVNTAGKGVADDIIEGTKKFVAEHSYIDAKKIGCIGASYGGFMTQYLQTQTDIFAAAISHAGISDHASYWGEGYWGYSYSEVSMAGSYPWANKQLYVDQSPLYNADKIHTPLLFLHGTADTNVPVGESIQMYTALKLLGRETAFVEVEGENHWIVDYQKRIKWQNTIYAWFAKWLQGDDTWWNAIYTPKKF